MIRRVLLAIAVLAFAASASGDFLLRVQGGQGSAPAAGADADFAQRCAAAGVLRCIDFDSADWITSSRGKNFGIIQGGANTAIDTSTKASGAGSMRYTFPAGLGNQDVLNFFAHFLPCSGAGNAPTNCSQPYDDGGLDTGDEIYIQWRARYNAAMLDDDNFVDAGGTPLNDSGWKIADLGLGDLSTCETGSGANVHDCPSTCSQQHFELVVTTGSDLELPGSYVNCGGNEDGNYGFAGLHYTNDGGNTHSVQNKITGCSSGNNYVNCRHVNTPDVWYTFKLYVKMGHFNSFDNEVKLWMGTAGQPLEQLVNCSAAETRKCGFQFGGDPIANNGVVFNLVDDDTGENISGPYQIAKFWLLPYYTSLDHVVSTAIVWYDELVMSTQDIADPLQ